MYFVEPKSYTLGLFDRVSFGGNFRCWKKWLMNARHIDIKELILLVVISFVVVVVVLSQKTGAAGSDPRGTLLVSQEIVQSGTIRLDKISPELLSTFAHQITSKNGHTYNYFPIGTALFSVPFVALANLAGFDMETHEPTMQLVIAAVLNVLIVIVLYLIARRFISFPVAALVVSIYWFGSSLGSTIGTALWSHGLAFLCVLIAIFGGLKIRDERIVNNKLPIILGSFLFSAYLARPTSSIFVVCALLWYFSENRRAAVIAGVSCAAFVGLFIAWSFREYGQWLPDYYLPKRIAGGEFPKAAIANLISPARGLFIYSPFLLLSVAFSLLFVRRKDLRPLLLVTLIWPVLHWVTISRFPHWWGGWSFGARIMVDVLPGLFLALVVGLREYNKWKRLTLYAFITTGVFSVFVNTYQGLFNPYAYLLWNKEPDIDKNPRFIFDWQYPQFLHNKQRHKARLSGFTYSAESAPPFDAKKKIGYSDDSIRFEGFSSVEDGFRWTDSTKASFKFWNDDSSISGVFLLRGGFNHTQRVAILMNGQLVFHDELEESDQEIRFTAPVSLLKIGENVIEFDLPDAAPPGNGDQRKLALRFIEFSYR